MHITTTGEEWTKQEGGGEQEGDGEQAGLGHQAIGERLARAKEASSGEAGSGQEGSGQEGSGQEGSHGAHLRRAFEEATASEVAGFAERLEHLLGEEGALRTASDMAHSGSVAWVAQHRGDLAQLVCPKSLMQGSE